MQPLSYLRGAFYLVRGARTLFAQRREVGRLVVIPFVLGLAATGALASLFRTSARALTAALALGEAGSWAGSVVTAPFRLLAAATSGWLFTVLYVTIAGPLCDRLSEHIERLRLGDAVPRGTFLGILRDLAHEIPRLATYGLSFCALWLVGRLVPFALPIGTFFLTAGYLVYNALDYSMARRHLSRSAKQALLRRHRAAVLGLGMAEAALALVPIVNLLVAPLGAAGGTLLYLDVMEPLAS